MRPSLLLLSLVTVSTLGVGCNPMYAPCARQLDCAQGLRCINLGGDYGSICTEQCTVQRNRSGLPDAIDNDAFYEEGTAQNTTVSQDDAACLEGGANVIVENGNFDVQPENEGSVIGVCRISDEQVASGDLGGSSNLTGWCVPL